MEALFLRVMLFLASEVSVVVYVSVKLGTEFTFLVTQ